MMEALWNANPGLAARSRWLRGERSTTIAAADVALLMLLGVLAAAATSAGGMTIPLPGHTILRGTLPLVLGVSLVPRRSAGTLMSAAAVVALAALRTAGFGPANIAAGVGLAALGPALDVALARVRPGWRLYAAVAAAGLAANLLAFAARMGMALVLPEAGGGRGIMSFWPLALVSFAAFGVVAGLLSGAVWFRLRPASESETPAGEQAR